MHSVQVHFDREVFSLDVVAKAAHRHTQRCAVEVTSDSVAWIVRLEALNGELLPPEMESLVRRDALDEHLRASVHGQTHDLHRTLIDAAFKATRVADRSG